LDAGIRESPGERALFIYILRNENFPVFLVGAYPKNEKENLTKAERNDLAKMADSIFEKYRSKAYVDV
jgi:hypothetical protein